VYTIFIETRFSAAHSIQQYKGPCSELHGHTWKVRIQVRTETTNRLGICMDFKDLKKISEQVVHRLDHRHINTIPPFDKINPTAENLSRYIYDEIKKKLPDNVMIHRVTVWESDSTGVSYSEDSHS